MRKPVFFTLEELLKSDTATKHRIPNLPSWEVIEHLNELALFLDGIREAWGSGIRITSGFRCPQLNQAVGGVQLSGHQYGYACDMVPTNGKLDEFEAFLKRYLKDKAFDECLWERKTSGSRWVHFSIRSSKGLQRRKMFGLVAA